MTKRDYMLLSDVLSRHELPRTFLVDLCNALYMQNYRFDTERFLRVIDNKSKKELYKPDKEQ